MDDDTGYFSARVSHLCPSLSQCLRVSVVKSVSVNIRINPCHP